MVKLYNKFWVNVTIVLSLIFIILGLPAFLKSHSAAVSVLITVVGVCFIWITYFIRGYMWSNTDQNKKE
jgi:hypothetical protein